MILPQTHFAALIVMILSLLCVGLWVNTYKLAGKLRFEVYYIDFAIGLGIAAVVFAFTLGNLGFDGFSLMDDLMQVHKRQWVEAFGAGVVFNLANMFLMAAISVSSLAVSFPVAFGFTLVLGLLLGQIGLRSSNPLYLDIGCVVVVAAIVADVLAHRGLFAVRKAATSQEGKVVRTPRATKGLVLALVSGLLMAGIHPLVELARTGDSPLGPYSLMFLFGLGAFISTIIFSLFFMNLPVQGQPLEIMDFVKIRAKRHMYGVAGGMVFFAGALAVNVAGATAPEAQLGRATTFALSNAGTPIAALCGLLVWKEFQEAGGRPKTLAFLALILFAIGLGWFSMVLG
jgi:glucose uptake protein